MTLIQLRRGTAAQWTTANPTLASGEVGVETDTGKFKIGNGTTAWTSLSYFASGGSGGGAVDSDNGHTGVVILAAADVGAATDAALTAEIARAVAAEGTETTRATAAEATRASAARLITAGTGLSGGGDLSLDRTLSLPNVGTAATTGSATQVAQVVTDAQGRVSSATAVSIAVAESAVTNLVADLAAKAALASPTFTGNPTAPSPTTASSVAIRSYVDAVAAGEQPKPEVACASTANLTLSGEQTVDAVVTSASRILVKDQTNNTQNGIYVTAAGAWARSTDADASSELTSASAFVAGGTANGGTKWIQQTASPTIGTSPILWVKTSSLVGVERQSNKGVASGYTPLNASTQIDDAYIAATITRDAELGTAGTKNVGTLSTDVAAGDAPAASVTYVTGLLHSAAYKDVGTGAADVAAGDAPQAAIDSMPTVDVDPAGVPDDPTIIADFATYLGSTWLRASRIASVASVAAVANSVTALPELTTSDPAKVPISTVGGVTTLDVSNVNDAFTQAVIAAMTTGYFASHSVVIAEKTTTYAAAATDFVPCNTTTAAFTVTLPTAPTNGAVVVVQLIAGTNTLTVAAGGTAHFDSTAGPTTGPLTMLGQTTRFTYYATSNIWYRESSHELLNLEKRYGASPSALQTASLTGAAGLLYNCDTSAGGFTVTLPTTPVTAGRISVRHAVQGASNVVTVAAGGTARFNTSAGPTTDTLPLVGQVRTYQYSLPTNLWYVVWGDTPLTGQDARFAPRATFPVALQYTLGDETTAITVGTAKLRVRAPFAFTLTGVRASLVTASTSGIPTFDIKENGTTVLGTKLSVDATELTSTTAASTATITDTAIADDAIIAFDVTVAGTGAAGAKITLLGTRVV